MDTPASRSACCRPRQRFLCNRVVICSFIIGLFELHTNEFRGCPGYRLRVATHHCLCELRNAAIRCVGRNRKSLVGRLSTGLILVCSIDACLYCGDGEMVVGSPVKQLARSSPANVIYHPMQYLDGRSDPRHPNQVAVGDYWGNGNAKTTDSEGYPLFAIPGSDPLSLETVLTELFKKVLALASLPFHKKPCISVIAGRRNCGRPRQCRKISVNHTETTFSGARERQVGLLQHANARTPQPLDSGKPSLRGGPQRADASSSGERDPRRPRRSGEHGQLVGAARASDRSLALSPQEGLYRSLPLQRLAVRVGDQMDDALFAFALRRPGETLSRRRRRPTHLPRGRRRQKSPRQTRRRNAPRQGGALHHQQHHRTPAGTLSRRSPSSRCSTAAIIRSR